MEGHIIAVDIKRASPVSPADAVPLNLMTVLQHHNRPSADNTDFTECPDPACSISLLCQNNRSVPRIQGARIFTTAGHHQCSLTSFMKCVSRKSVHHPVNTVPVVHDDSPAHPGLIPFRSDRIITIKRERTRPLDNIILQDNRALTPKGDIFPVIQTPSPEAVHLPYLPVLRKGSLSASLTVIPHNVTTGNCRHDSA